MPGLLTALSHRHLEYDAITTVIASNVAPRIWSLNKMAEILQTTFQSQKYVIDWKTCILIQISLRFVGPLHQKNIIGSGNGF